MTHTHEHAHGKHTHVRRAHERLGNGGRTAVPAWLRVALALFTIAFGANVFAPMLPVYKQLNGLSESNLTLIFALYVAGLVPALLIGGPLSDRIGRRALIRPALLCSGAASTTLMIGGALWLTIGRFIAGAAIGLVMAAGAAWLKQLSPDNGASQATIALSAGFGGGPLIGGLVAQWLPHPGIIPFALHLTILAIVTPLAWNTPEPGLTTATQTATPTNATSSPTQNTPQQRRPLLPRAALRPRFLLAVAAWAPWGFGTATTSFLVLTHLSAHNTPAPIAYTGAIGAITMLTGASIQPAIKRYSARHTSSRSAILGLATATAGLATGIGVAHTHNPWLTIPAALLLGSSYGIMMVSGLKEVETIAPPHELGALIAVFYSLTYIGFFAPYALSILGPRLGYAQCLGFGIIVTLLSIPLVARAVRYPA